MVTSVIFCAWRTANWTKTTKAYRQRGFSWVRRGLRGKGRPYVEHLVQRFVRDSEVAQEAHELSVHVSMTELSDLQRWNSQIKSFRQRAII
jgi:hypothetical protein